MPDLSPRLALPFIVTSQAQKEVTHNEALTILDSLTHLSIEDADLAAPPPAPVPGQSWIVAAPATGDWAGHAGEIAAWTEGGWRFIVPFEGLSGWLRDTAQVVRHDGTIWHAEGAIADPAGGVTVDSEARAAITTILAALRNHGLIAT